MFAQGLRSAVSGLGDAVALSVGEVGAETAPQARAIPSNNNPTGIGRQGPWVSFTEGFLNLNPLQWASTNIRLIAEEVIWERVLRE